MPNALPPIVDVMMEGMRASVAMNIQVDSFMLVSPTQ